MLTGEQLGQAIKQAMKLKNVSHKDLARHFSVKPPSVYGWLKDGRIGKDKLPGLWAYFSDVVGPAHWGLDAWPLGELPPPAPANDSGIASAYARARPETRVAIDLLLLPNAQRAKLKATHPLAHHGIELLESGAKAAIASRKTA